MRGDMEMRGPGKTLGGMTLGAAIAALLFLHPMPATAHARWDLNGIVKPRTTATGLKADPCGVAARSTAPATFAPGQTIEVTFEETINHPGHYRIAFSPANDQGFNTNVLLNNIPDNMGAETPMPHLFHAVITLPMQACDACTLQLIQVMSDTNSNYYSCSDIKLVAGNSGNGSSGGGTATPPVPTDPKEIAQNLLEDFSAADADQNNVLTLTEAQTILPGLKLDLFSALDANHNGTLTTTELNAIIPSSALTPAPKAKATAAAGVEWVTLLALLPFALLRRPLKCHDQVT